MVAEAKTQCMKVHQKQPIIETIKELMLSLKRRDTISYQRRDYSKVANTLKKWMIPEPNRPLTITPKDSMKKCDKNDLRIEASRQTMR